MSLSVIHDYEQGKREPSLRSAAKLAQALGTDCRAFVNQAALQKPVRRPQKGK
jgi:hypothetical protein